MLSTISAKATSLARARREGDPKADVLYVRLARRGELARANLGLVEVRDTLRPLPRDLPPELVTFLDDEGLPRWADRSRILRAQHFAQRHSVAITVALFCGSLPMAFTGAKGAAVLLATGRIERDLDARINETGRFVFDVLMPGGFESGRAIRSCQKVRLLHAAVRARVLDRVQRDVPGEIPINQEDLVGTLTCFSVVVLDALERMGIAVSASEAEDFFHLWRVAGALLGIRAPWLPRDLKQARRMADAIRARQTGRSSAGRELARVLLDGIERHLPARGFGVIAPGLVRYLLGDGAAAVLGLTEGLRSSDLAALLPRALTPLAHVWPALGRALLEHVMAQKLGGREPAYARPFAVSSCPFHPTHSEESARA